MRQLVELKSHAEEFSELGVEVIAVFREEAEGVDGLAKVRDRMKVDFTLALDKDKATTPRYSPGKMEFTNYVVDSAGVIRAAITGDLRNRAKSDELLEVLSSLKDDE